MKLVTPYVRTPFAAFTPWADFERELNQFFTPATAGCQSAVGVPVTDVREDANSFVISAELPGVRKEDLQVSLHEGVLTLAAERREEVPATEGKYHRKERRPGRWERRFDLGPQVTGDAITAAYKDGVLTVTVPKTEAAKPRQIDVTVN